MKLRVVCLIVGFLLSVLPMAAQTSGSGPVSAQVPPPLVNFSGVLTDVNGKPLTGVVGVTFSLYQEQQDGSPLWLETQNVRPNSTGHYTVVLGSASSQGISASIFASGQARWLGVRVQGQAEQPRVLLVSAPYALKAGDAETLGGKPASAFLAASGNVASGNNATANTVTGTGKKDYVPLWLSKTKLGSSQLFQSTAGDLGIGTTAPAANLDVNGTSNIRNTLTLFPNGSAPTLSVSGTAFNVSNTGLVSFVSGQTFPGAGTVTSVGSGAGLTGWTDHDERDAEHRHRRGNQRHAAELVADGDGGDGADRRRSSVSGREHDIECGHDQGAAAKREQHFHGQSDGEREPERSGCGNGQQLSDWEQPVRVRLLRKSECVPWLRREHDDDGPH